MSYPNVTKSPESPLPEQLSLSISPLIWMPLWSLYLALTLPLPILAGVTHAHVPSSVLWLGIGLGGIALQAALSEQVQLDQTGICVRYPGWVPKFFRSGWSLEWTELQALKARPTSQGGRVYYLVTHKDQAYLLPVRVAGFARMVRFIQTQTQLDTTAIKPLAQPWMYGTLFLLTLILAAADVWILGTGMAAMGGG